MRPHGAHSACVPGLHLPLYLRYFVSIMTGKAPLIQKTEAQRQAERKAQRLAEQLRANLQRRKAQHRARREGKADETDGLPVVTDDTKSVD
jgi:hypothetical protein